MLWLWGLLWAAGAEGLQEEWAWALRDPARGLGSWQSGPGPGSIVRAGMGARGYAGAGQGWRSM